MIRVLWATDVHLNAAEPDVVDGFCNAVNEQDAMALMLGGDVADGHESEEWLGFLADRIEIPIYFVLGNHEYYGSDVTTVRERMARLRNPRLLPDAGVVQLEKNVALVGEGGWGDARLGNFDRSPTILTDYVAIKELSEAFDLDSLGNDLSSQQALKAALMDLGTRTAEWLQPTLVQAVSENKQVLVLTHVPPFKEACWSKRGLSDDNWLPGFSCKAIGDLLLTAAEAHPDSGITVFCGHTHGQGITDIRSNLRVYTGEAYYGSAEFRVVEIDADQVTVI